MDCDHGELVVGSERLSTCGLGRDRAVHCGTASIESWLQLDNGGVICGPHCWYFGWLVVPLLYMSFGEYRRYPTSALLVHRPLFRLLLETNGSGIEVFMASINTLDDWWNTANHLWEEGHLQRIIYHHLDFLHPAYEDPGNQDSPPTGRTIDGELKYLLGHVTVGFALFGRGMVHGIGLFCLECP